jgi:ribosomal protein S18 acetylase RimI-like enzyme
LEIRTYEYFTLNELTVLWNRAFSGYYVNYEVDVDAFARQLANWGLNPSRSLVALVDGKPVGFIQSGVKDISGRRLSWNGGTAIVPEYRGQGVGKRLMVAAMEVYQETRVDVATLEVLVENTPALRLYESFGFRPVNRLVTLECEVVRPLPRRTPLVYQLALPQAVSGKSYYDPDAPWLAHWCNLNQAQAFLIADGQGVDRGYALFSIKEDGIVTLHQFVPNPRCAMTEAELCDALQTIWDMGSGRAVLDDFPVHDERMLPLLQEMGFVWKRERHLMHCRL